MKFVEFNICDSQGRLIPEQHPRVYIAVSSIARIVKVPDMESVTYLDLGASGVYVYGDYQAIADELNEPFRKVKTKVAAQMV